MAWYERLKVPRAQRRAFWRDAQMSATRSALAGLCVAVAVQLVLGMGGDERHSAWMHTGPHIGLLLSLLYVQLGNRISPLKLLLISDGLTAFTLFSVGLYAANVWEGALPLAAACTVAQAFNSLGIPVVAATYSHIYPAENRGTLVSITRMLHGLSAMVSLLVLGNVLERSPGLIGWLFPAAGFFVLLAVWRYVHMPELAGMYTTRRSFGSMLRVLAEDKNFRRFQYFQMMLGVANLMSAPLLAVYVKEELNLPVDAAVLVVSGGAIEQAAVLVSVRFHGGLFDRFGISGHRAFSSVLIGLGFVIWGFADVFWLGVIAAILIGFGRAGGGVIWTIGSLYFAKPGDEGLYSGVHSSLTGLRGIAAPLVGLWFFEHVLGSAYQPLFYITAGMIFVSAIGHSLFVKTPRPVEIQVAEPPPKS
jgi:hypothetical protein